MELPLRYEDEKHVFSEELRKMVEVVKAAGQLALVSRDKGLDIDYKDVKGFTTSGDIEVDKFLTKKINEIAPKAATLSEESFDEGSGYDRFREGKVIIIDPIDGTGWYVEGGDLWTVTLACYEEGILQYGVTYQPATENLWLAQSGSGAFSVSRNGLLEKTEKLHAKSETNFTKVKIALGSKMATEKSRLGYLSLAERVLHDTRGLSIIESTALDLAWIAQGVRSSGYLHPQAEPWDKAAGILLVREAGGIATGWPEKEDIFSQGLIVAANQSIYDELYEIAKGITP